MPQRTLKNILVIGSGGREHALGWKLSQSPQVGQLYFAPGNRGTQLVGKNVDIGAEEIEKLVQFAANKEIDLTVVGPEAPLEKGIVNLFEENHLTIFGPSKEAAQLETSKSWAVEFMARCHIPHPQSQTFKEAKRAMAFINSLTWPKMVIKASGLAAGKGVFLPENSQEAIEAITRMIVKKEFAKAGEEIVIQERLTGPEVSVFALSDGKTAIPFLSAQDYKRVFDGNQGPNTGGMGSYAPVPFMGKELWQIIQREILQPTIDGMRKEGYPYKGLLYAGLMITPKGPKVLEFNARFGDPETQPLMMLLCSDLMMILFSCLEGTLSPKKLSFHKGASVCVVLAAKGYPGDYKKGKVIFGLERIVHPHLQVFQAGTLRKDGLTVTNGGRVLGVTAWGKDLTIARQKAYSVIGKRGVHFSGMHYRREIGCQL